MSLPLNRRDFDVFISHAHKDQAFVSQLDRWLTEKVGFKVWYDARELGGGSLLATDLQGAIERCRGILLIASEEALSSGWVKAEYNCAMDERANQEGFRVVALRVAKANPKDLMRGTTWIDLDQPQLDPNAALAIIRAFYPGEKLPNPSSARDVYISCSWQSADNSSGHAVCRVLTEQGFRMIGDAKDQAGFGNGNRVERIIASCGAFVGIVPFRGATEARADADPYKYFMREADFAARLGLPSVIVADPRITRADGPSDAWMRMDTDATECLGALEESLGALWERWVSPPEPQYIFYAVDLESSTAASGSPVRHIIERITGMPVVVGNEVQGNALHLAIAQKISDAFLVLADISDDNVNACIEAGMGLAAGTNVRLIGRGKPRNPPFMLRGAGQFETYTDEVEQIGVLHKSLRPYRRRVINSEM
jgi:hypothetical protein